MQDTIRLGLRTRTFAPISDQRLHTPYKDAARVVRSSRKHFVGLGIGTRSYTTRKPELEPLRQVNNSNIFLRSVYRHTGETDLRLLISKLSARYI